MARKKNRHSLIYVILIIILLIVFRFVEETSDDLTPTDRFIVTKVIDGDTFEMQGGDKVRLLSIDTPEKGEMYYNEAKQFLKNYTLDKTVQLRYANKRRDRYGRLLAYVFVDSVFINKVILENGLGYLYLFKDTESNQSETKELLAAQRQAIGLKQGIWSQEKSPEEYYININGSFRLHRPGCNSVSKLIPGQYQKFDNRLDGFKAGLSPCRNCKP